MNVIILKSSIKLPLIKNTFFSSSLRVEGFEQTQVSQKHFNGDIEFVRCSVEADVLMVKSVLILILIKRL